MSLSPPSSFPAAQNVITEPVCIIVPFAAGSTPQEFDAVMRAEAGKRGPVFKATNIEVQ